MVRTSLALSMIYSTMDRGILSTPFLKFPKNFFCGLDGGSDRQFYVPQFASGDRQTESEYFRAFVGVKSLFLHHCP
jgi:hypothetical protein